MLEQRFQEDWTGSGEVLIASVGNGEKKVREVLGRVEETVQVTFSDEVSDFRAELSMSLHIVATILNLTCWPIGTGKGGVLDTEQFDR